jgi:hypothetical protein
MTMYLSNRDVRPTGYEPCEFLESFTMAPAVEPHLATPAVDDENDEDDEDDEDDENDEDDETNMG